MDTSVHHLQPLEFFSVVAVWANAAMHEGGVLGCACRMALIPIFCSLLLDTVQPSMHHSPYTGR